MFDIVNTLGTGAFGDVFKVKCLRSTGVSESGTERVALSQKQSTKIKNDLSSIVGSGVRSGQSRALLED